MNKKEYMKQYCVKKRDKIKAQKKEYRLKNDDKIKAYRVRTRDHNMSYAKAYRAIHKEEIKKYRKKYSFEHTEHIKKFSKEWRLKNKEHCRKYSKAYATGPKKEHITKRLKRYRRENRKKLSDYVMKRYRTDPDFKLKQCLRRRLLHAIKGHTKSARTMELIGCTIKELWKHLESQFKPGMTRKNHGQFGWHVDHIKPIIQFNLNDPLQQRECFHWSNLQPLWASANQSKGAKIIYVDFTSSKT